MLYQIIPQEETEITSSGLIGGTFGAGIWSRVLFELVIVNLRV